MQRITRFVTLFGVGLSVLAVIGIVNAVSNAFLPSLNFQWGRRQRHPLDILGVLYGVGVLLLSQSKNRSATMPITAICAIGYLFLFGFIA
jgi:O-antigen ligase